MNADLGNCRKCDLWVANTLALDDYSDERLRKTVSAYHLLGHPDKFILDILKRP